MPKRILKQLLDIDRFKAISDGVITVAITLLVLDLKIPAHLIASSSVGLWNIINKVKCRFLLI